MALAAEIGPAGMRVATIGLGRVVSDVVVLPVDGQPQESVRRLGEVLAGRCAALDGRVLGVGGALFGLVNRRGDVVLAPDLGWRDVPLAGLLAEALPPGLPVTVRNDASPAALYEARCGAGRDAGDVLYLYAGARVGGGLTRRGHLVPGRQGLAGEVGHMLVNPSTGRSCRCGRVGCWETEVNGRALRDRWSGAPVGTDDAAAARAVLDAAGRGDRGPGRPSPTRPAGSPRVSAACSTSSTPSAWSSPACSPTSCAPSRPWSRRSSRPAGWRGREPSTSS